MIRYMAVRRKCLQKMDEIDFMMVEAAEAEQEITWSSGSPMEQSTQSKYDGSLVFLHNLEADAEGEGHCDEDQGP